MHHDVVAEVRKQTGDGVDVAFEAAGSPKALEQTISVTRPRGKVICGGNQPLDQSLPLQFIESMMRRELTITGCFMSYSAPFPGHEWTESVTALEDGSLDMEAMISHHFPLAETPDVFTQISAHTLKHRKIILHPEGS
jgi:L-iditol 2-dehydrogenase